MHGPSWQEPESEDVGADPGAPGEKNIPAAFLTGIVMAAVALGALALGRAPFAILAGALILFAQGEFYAALHKRHYQPATALGLVFGALVLAAGYFHGESAVLSMVALCVIFSFMWEMATPARHRKDMMLNISLTLLGVLYIPVLASFGMVMLQIEPIGRALILIVLGLVFIYDTVAFGIGSLWGDHPMAPSLSPRKSWEGAGGATLVVILISMVAATSILDGNVLKAIGLGIVVAIFAPFGDLAESMLKRDLRVKDMGNLLPGHGGVIDRVDAVLFVLPAAWIFLRVALGA
jgi:phosphatidate cytidylyltransferase